MYRAIIITLQKIIEIYQAVSEIAHSNLQDNQTQAEALVVPTPNVIWT